MTEKSDWYKDMVKATKERERALTMVARWQEIVADAEATIKRLSLNMAAEAAQKTEQE